MTLEKATLQPVKSGEGSAIEFMFNPTQLSFEGIVETADNLGARSSQSGKPKVSFSNIQAYRVTITNVIFDTYETGKDVSDYINHLRASVQFVKGKERPPIYKFSWGSRQEYLKYCFVEKLSYKLTMFLAEGTPVRAVIDSLVLKETDSGVLDEPQLPGAE